MNLQGVNTAGRANLTKFECRVLAGASADPSTYHETDQNVLNFFLQSSQSKTEKDF